MTPREHGIEDYPDIPLHEAVDAMIEVGGGFMSALGHALIKADPGNSYRIMTTWADDIRHCHAIYKRRRRVLS